MEIKMQNWCYEITKPYLEIKHMQDHSKKQVTVIQAFLAMEVFLVGYYKQTFSDNIGQFIRRYANIARWYDSRYRRMVRVVR